MQPASKGTESGPAPVEAEPWLVLKVPIPPQWHAWLKEAAAARATSMAQIVRSLIRDLMITRHDRPAE